MSICLKQARRSHDAYVEQHMRIRDKRIKEQRRIIQHLLDVIEHRAEPDDWLMMRARTIAELP